MYQASADNPTVELGRGDSYVTYCAYEDESVIMTGTTVLMNEHFHRLSEASGEQYSSQTRIAKAAGANEGERPRNYWFDKTDTPKTYEEMLALKGPVFYTQNGLEERIANWTPPTQEGEPQDNQTEPHAATDYTQYETDGWLSGYFENNYANDMCRILSGIMCSIKYFVQSFARQEAGG